MNDMDIRFFFTPVNIHRVRTKKTVADTVCFRCGCNLPTGGQLRLCKGCYGEYKDYKLALSSALFYGEVPAADNEGVLFYEKGHPQYQQKLPKT